jgi:cytochrome d ubiquinol oxidase subunit I
LSSIYSVFLIAALYFSSRIIRRGPNLELPAPQAIIQPILNLQPAQPQRDRRPAEAQQETEV